MFGLELRRKGNIGNLVRDAQSCLAAHGLSIHQITPDMHRLAVAHSLQSMFAKSYFDVCTIRDCATMVKLVVPKETEDFLRAAHCVQWGDMEPEFRQAVTAMVMVLFKDVLTYEQDVQVVKVEPS